MKPLLSIFLSLVAIITCAGLGGFSANWIVGALGWDGALAVFTTLLLSMFLAFMFFVLGINLLRILGIHKTDRK